MLCSRSCFPATPTPPRLHDPEKTLVRPWRPRLGAEAPVPVPGERVCLCSSSSSSFSSLFIRHTPRRTNTVSMNPIRTSTPLSWLLSVAASLNLQLWTMSDDFHIELGLLPSHHSKAHFMPLKLLLHLLSGAFSECLQAFYRKYRRS